MGYKLQIQDTDKGFNFNARYENLAKAKRPGIVAKNSKGDIIELTSTHLGKPLRKGSMVKKWLDDNDNEYGKDDLTFWLDDEQVEELSQTKVFDIEGYQSLNNYTDTYVIGTYYELSPSDDDMKKDRDRKVALNKNLNNMRKLWKYLDENKMVARGEFCPASRGFVASDGYIRAIKINGDKWGLEIGVFKEEKVFQHLQEGEPKKVEEVKGKSKKLKMV